MFLLPDFRVKQRDFLLEISRAMTAQLDLGEVLRLILRSSVSMLAGEVGLIALREPDSRALRVRALIGVSPDKVQVFAPLLTGVSDEGDSIIIPDFEHKLRTVAEELALPLRQLVALPMVVGHEFMGVIYVFRSFTGTTTLNDQQVLQSFADQAAIAVHNARLYQAVNQERQRLERILHNSADGVMILDGNRRIQTINRAMSRICGYAPEQVIGELYDQVIKWAGRPQGRDLIETMKAGWPLENTRERDETLYAEGDLLRPDGTTIGVGMTYAPLIDDEGRLINIIINVRDITHVREAQKMKSTFISVISHELKTPVALIKGYAGTLRREDAQWDREQVQHGLSVIEEEADRLTELIENLLAATKLQAEGMQIKYEDVALDRIARAVVERFKTQTDKHTFVVEFPPDFPIVPGDATRLRQVIDNLVSNAVKYSPNGGTIRVAGTFTDDEVQVSVQDEGVGLPEDQWERIFERFYRVDDALSRKTQGTGLGLYLARAVVEAHGGHIGVSSVPGEGSTFTFTVPRHRVYQ
ncbi:MAG: ATP-binding protein [Anaerolineae bacterium]